MAGARGTTLGDAATDDTGAAGAEVGLRCGAGGGTELRTPGGANAPGMTPRDDGGGGMRDVGGGAPPTGLGGMLTGLGTTLIGAAGAAASEAVEALGSFSSPIEVSRLAAQGLRTAQRL